MHYNNIVRRAKQLRSVLIILYKERLIMYKCKYCSKEFETKQKLARHIQACELNPTNVKVECPKCHKLFYWTRLKYHLAHCGPNNRNNRCTGKGQN